MKEEERVAHVLSEKAPLLQVCPERFLWLCPFDHERIASDGHQETPETVVCPICHKQFVLYDPEQDDD